MLMVMMMRTTATVMTTRIMMMMMRVTTMMVMMKTMISMIMMTMATMIMTMIRRTRCAQSPAPSIWVLVCSVAPRADKFRDRNPFHERCLSHPTQTCALRAIACPAAS